jgi:hypothetical protein
VNRGLRRSRCSRLGEFAKHAVAYPRSLDRGIVHGEFWPVIRLSKPNRPVYWARIGLGPPHSTLNAKLRSAFGVFPRTTERERNYVGS